MREGGTGIVLICTEVAVTVWGRIVGIQVCFVDRPAAVRHVRASFEVYIVKRSAAPAPNCGRTTKSSLPVQIQTPMSIRIHNLSLVQVLRPLFESRTSAL